ncbi:unnamed protein product [Clavelina lepadiformis]|uniref:Uncharacterized protein n=1 Tax=Clavelina lepadiformis TaxID=159417 RepID=A0ABP0FJ44_CLALP
MSKIVRNFIRVIALLSMLDIYGELEATHLHSYGSLRSVKTDLRSSGNVNLGRKIDNDSSNGKKFILNKLFRLKRSPSDQCLEDDEIKDYLYDPTYSQTSRKSLSPYKERLIGGVRQASCLCRSCISVANKATLDGNRISRLISATVPTDGGEKQLIHGGCTCVNTVQIGK